VTADVPAGRIASVAVPSPAERTPPLAATQPLGQRTVALLATPAPSVSQRATLRVDASLGSAAGTATSAATAVSVTNHLPKPQLPGS
jgi:hypothetical protein